MKQLLLFFLLFSSITALGQETMLVVKPGEKGTGKVNEYYVLKTDNKVNHGTYVQYSRTPFGNHIILHETGSYYNGKQTGQWDYFSGTRENNLIERGTFADGLKEGLWTSFYVDSIAPVLQVQELGNNTSEVNVQASSFKVKQTGMYEKGKRTGTWTTYDWFGNTIQQHDFTNNTLLLDHAFSDDLDLTQNRSVTYIGTFRQLQFDLYNNSNIHRIFPYTLKSDSTALLLDLHISETGELTQVTHKQGKTGKRLVTKLQQALLQTNGNWIPAAANGKPVSATCSVIFLVKFKKEGRTQSFKTAILPADLTEEQLNRLRLSRNF